MPLIPGLGRQRQVDFSEFKASLVYRVNSRTVRIVTQRNPALKSKANKNKQANKKIQYHLLFQVSSGGGVWDKGRVSGYLKVRHLTRTT